MKLIRISTTKGNYKQKFVIHTAWNTRYSFQTSPCFMFWLVVKKNDYQPYLKTINYPIHEYSGPTIAAITTFEKGIYDFYYYQKDDDKIMVDELSKRRSKTFCIGKLHSTPGGHCCKLSATITSPDFSKCYFAWVAVPGHTNACVPRLRPPFINITTGYGEKGVEADMDAEQKTEFREIFGQFLDIDDSQLRKWIHGELKQHFDHVFYAIPTKSSGNHIPHPKGGEEEDDGHLLNDMITKLKKNGDATLQKNNLFLKNIPCDPLFNFHKGGRTELRQLVYYCYGLETKLSVVDFTPKMDSQPAALASAASTPGPAQTPTSSTPITNNSTALPTASKQLQNHQVQNQAHQVQQQQAQQNQQIQNQQQQAHQQQVHQQAQQQQAQQAQQLQAQHQQAQHQQAQQQQAQQQPQQNAQPPQQQVQNPPVQLPQQQFQHQGNSSTAARRREIYRFSSAHEPLFASSWSNKVYPENKFRMVVGTVLEEDQICNNKIFVIELDENAGELVKRASLNHGYPSSALQFIPTMDPSLPELIASATNHLKIFRYNPFNQAITEECELFSNKSSAYSSPLTNLDWNEIDPSLVGTSSIDTTCTIWNIEVGQTVGHTSVQGSVKTQLIAHEKPVHDIAFTRMDNGKDQFATAGADGSVRLFDLRSLQHSTILYEDIEKRALNHVAWNKLDPTKLATVANESNEVVILDVRAPCRPIAKFSNHRGSVNGIAWAPHSTVHICTAGSDRQALIWQMNHFNKDEPILAYNAEGEIAQIHWGTRNNQWICICFNNHLEILRV
uniref:Uncharacterized protein n=1 Tax=Ditylenchus dipsaci TaxID=166011 RepID=A0A915DMG8_9BILA